jgi:outer membrane protein TolC
MRALHSVRGIRACGAALAVGAVLFVYGHDVSADGQDRARTSLAAAAAARGAQQAAAVQAPPSVRRLTLDEAVAMALEANLGIKAERLSPQIQDFNVAQAQAAFTPEFFNTSTRTNDEAPPDSFLVGDAPRIVGKAIDNVMGVRQQTPWRGGRYQVEWNATRSETTAFTSFNPRLRSTLDFRYVQPLVRDFSIDQPRWQLDSTRALRDIADVQLRQSIVATTRAVRNAYWDLVFTIANLQVSQQALDLARQQLKDNRTRVEVGTMASIDIVEAEAEVARNEESVIVAETAIQRAQDLLRSLVLSPDQADFWSVAFEPAEAPELKAQPIDVEAAVRTALDSRTDLQTTKRQLETTRLDVRYYQNQKLPAVDVNLGYGLVGLGGTQNVYDTTGGGFPPPIIGEANRSFNSVIGDIFGTDYANWSVAVSFGYPLGTSQAEAALASARLQQTQGEISLKNQQMLVATTVRDQARQVQTNLKRVEVTQKARELAERRLEAEQKKLAVGISSTFQVFQAQRDLSFARNSELRAVIDYNKSLVDFEAVQQAPLGASLAGR